MSTFEAKEDCPPVEEFMWERLGFDYNEFAGIKELSFADLLALRSLIDHQMNDIVRKGEEAHKPS